MLTPVLEKLLILQDRDGRCRSLEAQITGMPREVATVEAKIAAEKAAMEAGRVELRDLEVKKKGIETEIGQAEGRLAKYKTHQSQVRKNDEYQALGNEIATTQAAIGGLEEQELAVMFEIDAAKARLAAADKVSKENVAAHESRIRMLNERVATLREELKGAEAERTTARAPVEEPVLRIYDRIATRTFPVCAPMRENKCGGCHLKVSGEVESQARNRHSDGKLATCDQCGRILYWEG
ncbi:hypothetical protein K0B96_12555 [Horticoccus luteus]|uniref:C4-type zinc ribbon domain-containing protein n=1 Tax=Horticoccus luteus TaxID=2862869 RepID=A0A8F9TV40_9BACT|nr:C4-type zinc ribbon domain-containing protein [Horticoccus luteus]QYM78137.1 hypothetical protein K0B96_12555 [Horticoccus luteus]